MKSVPFAHLILPTVISAAFVSLVALSALPTTVIQPALPHKLEASLVTAFPQGWAFFTKSPKEPELVPLQKVSGGKLEMATQLPTARIENVFGFSRYGRAQGVELAILANSVPGSHWQQCDGSSRECRNSLDETMRYPLVNETPGAILCGELMLLERAATPYNYQEFTSTEFQSRRAALVEVTCE